MSIVRDNSSQWEPTTKCPIPGKYKYIESLNENYKQIAENYELMDLISFCDDAIGSDNISVIRGIMNAA